MTILRIVTVIFGAIVSLLVILGFTIINDGGLAILGSLILLLYHGIAALITLPFVIFSMRQEEDPRLFDTIIMAESAIAAISLILTGAYVQIDENPQGNAILIFFIPALLNLIMTYFAYRHKSNWIERNSIY